MAGEWRTEPLERLIDPGRAISYGIVQPGVPASDGIPIVRVTDIRDGRIATDDSLRVSRDIEAAYSRTRLRGGELLLTLVGTIGEAAVVPDSLAGWNTARAVAVIPVRPDVGSYWVKLALQSPEVRHIIDSRLNTTVQATLNLRDVAQLPIAMPPEPERRAIVHVLGTLDDKIELNRRMSETLEAIALAIFRSWFINFDPVRAKSENRDSGLPKPIADLFPNRFEESELGEIPEGWSTVDIGNLVRLGRDSIHPSQFPDETFDHFSIPAFDEGRKPKPELGSSIKSNKLIVPPDAVLLSKLNPRIRRIWLPVVRDGYRGICSTEFLVALPAPGTSREFIFSFLSSKAFSDVFETLVTGTSGSHQRVKPEGLLAMDAVIPVESVVHQFTKVVRPLLTRVTRARDESGTLSALRDTLLQKLVSGELRIKDAERFVVADSKPNESRPRLRAAAP